MANTVPILTRGGEKSGEVALPAELFGIEPNEHVMYEAVRAVFERQQVGPASAMTVVFFAIVLLITWVQRSLVKQRREVG